MAELNVGAHVSLHGNPASAVEETRNQGFRSMQIFASSPGAWRPPIVDPPVFAAFVEARRGLGVDPLFIHAIYLINLASADESLYHRSISSLIRTLEAGRMMEARGVITHIGSHAGNGFETVADRIAGGLTEILNRAPGGIDLILENSAGAGGLVGASLDELATLIKLTGRPDRLKIALDTAHLTGAGWDFRAEGGADRLVDEIEAKVGLDRLAVIHANDSAQPVGSRKDRHANIGEGHVGEEGFRNLVAQPALRAVPWILETPGLEERERDQHRLQEMAAGRELIHGA
ncbi:MAG TPA: deoxyribonuclease IV [Chloroflexota bacterium]|nr:deoxyribonuclease IV [Chloroflexota bacterium]